MRIIRYNGFPALLLVIVFSTGSLNFAANGKNALYQQNPPSSEDCLECHSDKDLSMDRNGKEISLFVDEKVLGSSPHRKLECISCHDGFDPEELPHKENIQPINCMTCHKDAKIRHLFHPQMMRSAVNAEGKDVSCKSCHGTHDAKKYKNIGRTASINVCAKCHNTNYNEFRNSIHGFGAGEGEKPGCITCHKSQITKGSYGNDYFRLRISQQELCLSCHANTPLVTSRFTYNKSFVAGADSNMHGQLLRAGNGNAASCVDCHQSHKIMKASGPGSSVAGARVPEICGVCHKDIKEDYSASVHFAAFQKNVKDAPVCSGCHNEHQPETGVAVNLCGSCHDPVEISPDFAQSTSKTKVARITYHGIKVEKDKVTMANCVSCHGPHRILKSDDAASQVNKKNLQKTCGECHPGAGEDFVSGDIHKNPNKPLKVASAKKDTADNSGGSSFVTILLIIVAVGVAVWLLGIFLRRRKRTKNEN